MTFETCSKMLSWAALGRQLKFKSKCAGSVFFGLGFLVFFLLWIDSLVLGGSSDSCGGLVNVILFLEEQAAVGGQ